MIAEMRSLAGPARGGQDPAWLIQRAWSVFRLPRLQELIASTIAELRVDSSSQLSVIRDPSVMRDPSVARDQSARPVSPDPAAEAFRACCEELREASGMPGAEAARAQHAALLRRYMREQSLDWSEAFARALDAYREAAAHAVERALARAGSA